MTAFLSRHGALIGLGAAVVAILAFWSLFPVERWIEAFVVWIGSFGPAGVIAFALVYILGTLVLGPGSVMGIAAGLAYGLWGLPLVLVTGTLAAGTAFLLARYAARDKVTAAIAGRPKFRALAKAIDEEGWKLVGLLRLSIAVPFALTNYLFGVTNVRLWPFLATTFVGMAPASFVWVNIGALGHAAATGGTGPLQWVMLAVGLVAAVVAGIIVTRKAREKLRLGEDEALL